MCTFHMCHINIFTIHITSYFKRSEMAAQQDTATRYDVSTFISAKLLDIFNKTLGLTLRLYSHQIQHSGKSHPTHFNEGSALWLTAQCSEKKRNLASCGKKAETDSTFIEMQPNVTLQSFSYSGTVVTHRSDHSRTGQQWGMLFSMAECYRGNMSNHEELKVLH